MRAGVTVTVMGDAEARTELALQVAEAAVGADARRVAAGLVRCVGASGGWAVPDGLRVSTVDPLPALADISVPEGLAGPALIGELYEAALDHKSRSAGAHYTPADLAARLVQLGAPPGVGDGRAPLIWDPACGGGAFLLAAADALYGCGLAPDRIVGSLLWGTDIDPGAVAVAEASLRWWAHRHHYEASPGRHLSVADTLLDPGCSSEDGSGATRSEVGGGSNVDDMGPLEVAAGRGFDLVVGNPPFQGQLAGGSVRSTATTAALRERWGSDVVQPYTDTSSLFLVAGARALAPGGRLVMVLPTSVLSARDSAAARASAAEVADLAGLWVAGTPVFGAAVQVCAVVLERPCEGVGRPIEGRSGPGRGVRRWKGRAVVELPSTRRGLLAGGTSAAGRGGEWSGYALAALGVPNPPVRTAGRLDSIATARAGFREEYYGLVDHVFEASAVAAGSSSRDDGGPAPGQAGTGSPEPAMATLPAGLAPLVTSGLIDPGHCAWGERAARFARRRFQRPAVDLAALSAAGGRAASWVHTLSVPKVVVANQTRVGEAAVDETGRWVASTPTIVVLAKPDRLWLIAAVICSPVGTIAALAATGGAARSADAIRHSVASVAGLPLPIDVEAWAEGAVALRHHDRRRFLDATAAAYGLSPTSEVDDWWTARAPWPD